MSAYRRAARLEGRNHAVNDGRLTRKEVRSEADGAHEQQSFNHCALSDTDGARGGGDGGDARRERRDDGGGRC